jgi:branched-chain amino acid transport system ATP-binding protein
LDEPYGGLTHEEAGRVARILKRLREEGQTTIVIEHRLGELLQLVERLVVIDFGRVIADAPPEEVLKNQAVIEAYMGREEQASAT